MDKIQTELDLKPYWGESPGEARERRIRNAVGKFLRGKRRRSRRVGSVLDNNRREET